jgi:hypothetical protein
MKKIISFILVIFISLNLTSCYNDLQKNSLEEYIASVNQHELGFSSHGIDKPEYFLPSISFLEDYEYLEGTYFWREDDSWREVFDQESVFPHIALLTLKYDESTYEKAKQTMLEEIEPYEDEFFQYNDYYFYENVRGKHAWGDRFPKKFTMACYNDENHALIFIGLYSGAPSCLEDKYLEDIEGNWKDFIDQYYGAYYDFSQ